MDGWTMFWGWMLVVVLVIYAGLSIGIAIGGFLDVKGMLTSIDDRHVAKKAANHDAGEES